MFIVFCIDSVCIKISTLTVRKLARAGQEEAVVFFQDVAGEMNLMQADLPFIPELRSDDEGERDRLDIENGELPVMEVNKDG